MLESYQSYSAIIDFLLHSSEGDVYDG